MGKSAKDIMPILIGSSVPQAGLVDQRGNCIQLSDLIEVRFSVLIFCRGGLCPYCNTQMGEIASVQGKLQKLGYQIVAISPDGPELLKTTDQKMVRDGRSVSEPTLCQSRFRNIEFFRKMDQLVFGNL